MSRTITLTAYCLRHGHPNTDESDLDDLGREQVIATCATHLKHELPFLTFVASSEMGRAKSTLTTALSTVREFHHAHDNFGGREELGLEWLLKDPRLPELKIPAVRPTNVSELVATFPAALALGMTAWDCLLRMARRAFFMSFNRVETGLENEPAGGRVLIVSHSGVIEAMATVAANQGVPLADIPMLSHADILRYTVQWVVDGGEISDPKILGITHLPCPIKTPA